MYDENEDNGRDERAIECQLDEVDGVSKKKHVERDLECEGKDERD